MDIQKSYGKSKLAQSAGIAAAVLAGSVYSAEDAPAVTHLEDRLESIVITAPFQASEGQTALPIGILSGEALREKATNSLGDTLKNEIGIANASFGPGVGQPIIRGQTGNRVSILQNGISLTDASNVSPDHANGTETLLADRIEVIRGPSTLLYGSGAVGGVVNVIDNRIPSQLVDHPHLQIEQIKQSSAWMHPPVLSAFTLMLLPARITMLRSTVSPSMKQRLKSSKRWRKPYLAKSTVKKATQFSTTAMALLGTLMVKVTASLSGDLTWATPASLGSL